MKQEFEDKIQQMSDYASNWSDIKFSDGFNSGRGRFSTQGFDSSGNNNHRFNFYEHYESGYESTMDMPTG